MGWEIDSSSLVDLIAEFKDKTSNLGPIINEYLWNEGAQHIKERILPFIPVSDRNKEHAAYSQPFTQTNGNLSVTVRTTGRWGYLVFPDEGRGEHNREAHEFMLKGGQDAASIIVEDLRDRILQEIT